MVKFTIYIQYNKLSKKKVQILLGSQKPEAHALHWRQKLLTVFSVFFFIPIHLE